MNKVLFIIDKIEFKYFEFNNLVTNFWLIKELLERGNEVFITTIPKLSLKLAEAYALCNKSFCRNNNIYYEDKPCDLLINDFDLVLFRPDPPVDIDYINATYIFDFVTKPKVVNSPAAIRGFNEKLHSVLFKDLMSDNIVTASLDKIEGFLKKHGQLVIKPLNRCFGSGVMYLYDGDPNTRTIINTMTNNETSLVMVQKYLPGVQNGDIRVLTLGDRILNYCVRKLPTKDDFKFNTHNDDFIVAAELSASEISDFTKVAWTLNNMGIGMAGLDVIEGKIIEVNVTSPCYFIKEINQLYGTGIEKDICDYLLTHALLSL